jgi:hypothetical protein
VKQSSVAKVLATTGKFRMPLEKVLAITGINLAYIIFAEFIYLIV